LQRGLTRFGEALRRPRLAYAPEGTPGFLFSRRPRALSGKRFAAKEAFAKAAGTGLRHPLNLRNLAITHTPLGQPGLHFHPELAFLAAQSRHYRASSFLER